VNNAAKTLEAALDRVCPGIIAQGAPAVDNDGAFPSESIRALAPEAVVDLPPQRWGLAARGALVEAGSPEFHFSLSEKLEVWSEDASRIYAQAAASQWDRHRHPLGHAISNCPATLKMPSCIS